MSVALILSFAGLQTVGQAAAATPAGAAKSAAPAAAGNLFNSSFEAKDAAPLVSSPFAEPVNVTGRRYNNGSLLGHVSAVTASAQNQPGEAAAYAADSNSSTKWLAFSNKATLSYQLDQPQVVKAYTLTSANDEPGRDPKAWTVDGSQDGATWTPVDTQAALTFSGRLTTKSYSIDNATAFNYYRLNITQNNGDGIIQLADWEILDGTNTPTPPGPMVAVVGNGPVSGPTVKSSVGFTGVKALRYAGSHLAAGPAAAADVLYDNLHLTVGTDTELAYKIFPTLSSDMQYPETFVALDLVFSDGTKMSAASGLTDQYGFGVSAQALGKAKAFFADQWNSERIDLSSAAGRTVTKILLTYDNPGGTPTTDFSGWLDDISLRPASPIDASSLTHYVDTRRGSNASSGFSRGNNIPATAVPNGFNFFTPMTDGNSSNWLYSYAQSNDENNLPTLQAIGISHEPSPWMGDRDQIAVMPSLDAGQPNGSPSSRGLTFQHSDEVAQPDQYSVTFTDGINAAVTPTDHSGVYRFSYPSSAAAGTVMIDQVRDKSSMHIAGDGTVTGWVEGGSNYGTTRMFAYGRFDRAPTAVGMASSRTTAAYANFDVSTDRTVTLRIATSFISLDQAQHSLELEVGNRSFGDVQAAAQQQWNGRLGVIDVPQATDVQKATLYSNLYRLNLYPNSQSENAGTAAIPAWKYASPVTPTDSAPATDTKTNAKLVDGKLVVNNGFWDTYRTVWPLYSMLYPDVAQELVDGFVQQYRDGGWIARWSSPGYADMMTGTSSDAAFAEAYISGAVTDNKIALDAFDAALKNATVLPTQSAVGRNGLDTSQFLGYTSTDTGQSVSWALEDYINDYAIGRMAQKLATDPATPKARVAKLEQDAAYLIKRSQDYVNLFSAEAGGYFVGRDNQGNFDQGKGFEPAAWGGDYTETNGWNFAFHAPDDVAGLQALYGGSQGLIAKLDQFFGSPETGRSSGIHEAQEARAVRMGQLGMSNQVSRHIPYLYAAAGDPSKTQAVVREALQRLFVGSEIGQGYLGDEDNGEMSSWYIFSALGFYPLSMGSGQYTVGSPLYKHATVHLKNGDLHIEAPDNSTANVYIQSATLDGKPMGSATIDEKALTAHGGTLRFEMGSTPSNWGDTAGAGTRRVPFVDATKASNGVTTSSDAADTAALIDDNSRSATTFDSAQPVITWDSGSGPAAVASYTMTNTSTASAPKSWTLSGSNDGKSWTPIDTRSDETFQWTAQTRSFPVADPTLYSRYQLSITATNTGAAAQLAELELLVDTQQQSKTFALHPLQNVNAMVGTPVTAAYATVSGGSLAEVQATVDFLDGAGPQAADVTTSPLGGLQIALPHTFQAAGVYSARVSAKDGDVQDSELVTVTVRRDQSLVGSFNNACITVTGTPANCDGNGYAYSRVSLAANGFVQGGTGTVPGTALTFDAPAVAAGKPDNAIPAGQIIRLHLGAGATQLSVIGTANETAQQITATLTYDDGSTQPVVISYGDWVGSVTNPAAGSILVAKTIGRLSGAAGTDNMVAGLFASAPVTLKAGRTAVSLTLPIQPGTLKAGKVHLFAIASDGTRTAPAALNLLAATVPATAVGTAFTAELGTVSGGSPINGSYTATVNWGDQTPLDKATVAADGTITGTHSYLAAGRYSAIVTADDGEKSVSATVDIAATEIYHPTLTVTPGSIAPGATITVSGAGFKANETVAISIGGKPGVPPNVSANASGAFSSTFTVPMDATDGTYPVVAVGETSAASATESFAVLTPLKPSGLTLAASAHTVPYGSEVVLTSTVAAGVGGVVTFFDADIPLGDVSIAGGRAALTLDRLEVGNHRFRAEYAPNAVYAAGAAGPVLVTVTALKVSLSRPTVVPAQQIYGAANRAVLTTGVTGVTSGTITFHAGRSVLATAPIVRSGSGFQASVVVPQNLPVGSYRSIVAIYAGNTTLSGAISSPATTILRVIQASAATMAVSGNSFKIGARPVVSVSVGRLSNGMWPTGQVAIEVDGRIVSRAALTAAMRGTLTVTLPSGYQQSISVRALFVPNDPRNIASAASRSVSLSAIR